MRHEEILDRSTTYGDYISLAVMDGWGDEEILNQLSLYTFRCTGERKGVSKTDIIDMLSEGYLLTRAILSELIDYIIENEPELVNRGK